LCDAEFLWSIFTMAGVVTSDAGDPLPTSRESSFQAAVTVVVLLLVFLVGIKGMGDGFKLLGDDALNSFFRATSNPFMGLVVGILATTLVQSSSVSTSMIVGLVASPENALPIANAIPMVMGANIGTTVTNTIVSLAHMGRRDEFERAFSVATCHDFFNFIAVAVFLPLEMATGVFQKLSAKVVGQIGGMSGADYQSPLKGAISIVLKPIKSVIESLVSGAQGQGVVLVLVSGGLIFVTLFLLVRTMRGVVQTRVEVYITRFLGSSVVLAVAVGAAMTIMVQSSSITTALLVPLAGAGLLTTRQAFPVTVGANLGTTVTALLAALAVSGPNASAGLQIAVVHLLFNMSATLLILPVPAIRDIPIHAAERLARLAARSRRFAIAYVVGLFYGLPALLAYLSNLFDQ